MKLTRISLVNWFLYNPVDIDIIGNTAIIGVNGTGKSTILDAIQAVLFGGDMNKIRFNAKASSKSQNKRGNLKRSLKSYCLGAYYTADDGKEPKSLRTDAESYLSLTFKDDNNEKLVNLFIAMEARFDEPKVDVRILGLARSQRALSCEDFIVRGKAERFKVLPIEGVYSALDLKGFNFKYCQSAKEYVSEMAILLGPDPTTGESITPEVLSSTLSKSLSIGEIDGVSNFVKRFILEDRPLNVESVINARNYYQQILKQIRDDEQRLDELKPIVRKMNRALKLRRDSVSLYWLYFEEAIAEKDVLLEELQEKRESNVEQYLNNRDISKRLSKEVSRLNDESRVLAGIIDNDDLKKEFDELAHVIEESETKQKMLINSRQSLFDAIRNFTDQDFTGLLASYIDTKEFSQLHNLLTDPEKINVTKVDKYLVNFPNLVSSVNAVTREKWPKLESEVILLTEQMKDLYNQIKDAESGQITLMRKTKLVISELARNNITATPLCILATVTEPRWQKAIEAVLGGKTEALIVEPKDEVDALRIYRRMRQEIGADIYNVSIVRTSKANEWLNRFKQGSAAEIVESDNELALAYLHRQLGGFMLVDTEKELTEHSQAMTNDGMVSTSSSTTRNKLPTTLKMIAEQSLNIPVWREEYQRLEQRRYKVKDNAKSLSDMHESSVRTQAFLDAFTPLSFTEIKDQIKKIKEVIADKKQQRDSIDLTSLEEKQEQLKKIDYNRHSKSKEINLLATRQGTLLSKGVVNKKTYINILKSQVPELKAAQKMVTQGTDFDVQHTDDLSQAIEFEKPEDLQKQAQQAETQSVNTFEGGKAQLFTYLNTIDFFIEQGEEITLEKLDRVTVLVNNQLDFIEKESLASHRKTAERAEREMNDAYRSDMINKLKAAFDEMFEQFRVINHSLRRSQFHGSTYAFRSYEKREFADLINYIKNASEDDADNVGDMFDNTPEAIKQDIDRLISGEAEGLSTIEDYREYFEYDVEIIKNETGEKTRLSALGDFGSGGENQAPFYVTLASALSSAWKTLRQPGDSVGLTLLDEAFNNLSEDNLISAKNYMNDVGLQIIVAAPSDREPTFRTMVDTFVYISREGQAVDITVDYITEKGRNILIKNNPNLNPELINEKIVVNE